MTTQEVAKKLVQYCREGKNIDAINELYADNIVSREQPGIPHELSQGKNEVLGKNNSVRLGHLSQIIVAGIVTLERRVTSSTPR